MATVTDRRRGRPGTRRRVNPPQSVRLRDLPSRALARLAALIAGLFALGALAAGIVIGLDSGPVPPQTGAATVVPANSLLYLHFSTDSSRPEVEQALSLGRRLPGASLLFAGVTGRLDAALSGSGSSAIDFGTDVRPWLGREAAFAVLDTPGSSAGTLIVLDVRNRHRASAFLAAHGAASAGTYRKVALLHDATGTTFAFLGHYLVLGQPASVQSAINAHTAGGRSLANSSTYGAAAAGEPPDRVLDLYVSAAGVRRALAPRQGLLGALGTLLDQPALTAATVTLSPASGGFSVRVHSTLDPKLARATARQSVEVTPTMATLLPAGSMMLFDVGNLRRAAPKLFAAAAKLGVASRAATLLTRLGDALTAQGVNLNHLFAIFGGEAALAIVPGRGGAGPAPVLVGRPSHPGAARAELSSLEGPLTQAFTPPSDGAGVVPEVGATAIGGVTVSELTLTPGLQFDWAVSHRLVVLSTSPAAIANVISHRASLGSSPAYRSAVGALPSPATSLVFFDLGPLLRLGSRLGLLGGSTLAAVSPDLDHVRSIGLASTRGESDTTTELQLQIR
jgi:uncharacterized protein DUF3352